MDRIPLEIWEHIFRLACVDKGTTGYSLTLSSKFFRKISEPYKLQSVSLHGYMNIVLFLFMLNQAPPNLRRVRNIFISSRSRVKNDDDDLYRRTNPQTKFDEAEAQKVQRRVDYAMVISRRSFYSQPQEYHESIADAIEAVLNLVAPDLEILEIDFEGHCHGFMKHVLTFPRLKELTCCGEYPLAGNYHNTMGPTKLERPRRLPHQHLISRTPSLRRLHIRRTETFPLGNRFLEHITQLAPNLTHLLFSNLQDDIWVESFVGVAMRLQEPSVETSRVTPLPDTIERVLLRPGGKPSGFQYAKWRHRCNVCLDGCRTLTRMDDRFILLPAQANERPEASSCRPGPISEREWLDRIAGGEGCWSEKKSSCFE